MKKLTKVNDIDLIVSKYNEAICKYDLDNVEVVADEISGMFCIYFTSSNNSFSIISDICSVDDTNIEELINRLNQESIPYSGYCF